MVKGLLGRIGRSLRGLLSGTGGRALRGFLGGSGGRALSRGEVGQDILKRLWKRTLKRTLTMDVADWGFGAAEEVSRDWEGHIDVDIVVFL